jgi:hypothetical protein
MSHKTLTAWTIVRNVMGFLLFVAGALVGLLAFGYAEFAADTTDERLIAIGVGLASFVLGGAGLFLTEPQKKAKR